MSFDVPEPSAPEYVPYSTRRITIEIEDGRSLHDAGSLANLDLSSRGVWSWLGNFMWVVFGGLQSAIVWLIAGLLCCITIVGIPCAHQCFKLSGLSL